MSKGQKITIYSAVGSLLGFAFSEIHNTHPTLTIITVGTLLTLLGHYDQGTGGDDKQISKQTI